MGMLRKLGMMNGSMRGASPLGGMILAIGLTLISIYGLAGWMGSYQQQNGEALNPALANTINSIIGSAGSVTNPTGGIFNNGLGNQIVTQANNTKGIIGSISGAASAAGGAFSFLNTIVAFVNPLSPGNFVNLFVIGPLAAIGVPATYAAYIGYFIVMAMLTLLVLSALLIFNLL